MQSSMWSFILLCLLGIAQALSSAGSRLLVVTDDVEGKDKYSKFWGDLQARGFSLTFSSPKSDPSLFKHGERTTDHVLILPTKLKALGPALTPQILLDFMQAEGNILLGLSSDLPTPTSLTSLLLELDISLSQDRDAVVVDHFNYDTSAAAETHDVLLLQHPVYRRTDVKNHFSGEGVLALPKTVGQTLGNASPLLASILSAPSTAYSYSPKEEADGSENSFAAGSQLSLITSMQGRNSARFAVLGSVDMLADKWFDASVRTVGGKSSSKTANRDFAAKLTQWVFKESGVLKVGKLQHWLRADNNPNWSNDTELSNKEANPKMYRIKNEATYSIELSEYAVDRWIPFVPPSGDAVQLEFSMLSPYHRLDLAAVSTTKDSTVFATSFTLPDQHGIFNFRVNYKRPFLTNVDEKRAVTVRHFAHDEWPRSFVISGAYVWIVGIWVTVAGFLLFSGFWLFSAPPKAELGAKKGQ